MKKLDERTKLLLYGGVTALIFLAALLVPLAFRNAETDASDGALRFGEKADIFAAYWSPDGQSAADGNVIVASIPNPGRRTKDYCKTRMEEIIAQCLVDRKQAPLQSEGTEYASVSNDRGTIQVCRKWIQYQGDWRNWVDVCFDMDTGEIYYLYVSCECVTGAEKYNEAMPPDLDTRLLADTIARQSGYDMLYFDWSGEAADSATVIYENAGSAVIMDLSCIYYESTLLDLRISCK